MWQPILDEAARPRAIDTVREICESLRAPPDNCPADLARGDAGIAVLFAYAAKADIGVPDAARVANLYLDRAIEQVEATSMSPALHGGFVGVAWALQHLTATASGVGDPCEDFDPHMHQLVRVLTEQKNYELVSGVTGLGVYAVERDSDAIARAVAGALSDLAEHGDRGPNWFSPPDRLRSHQRAHHPRGYYDLGAAHGVPAVIALLGQLEARGIEAATAIRSDATRWLLEQRQPDETGAAFPSVLPPEAEPASSRLAWCYGDPGVGACLLTASIATGDGELRERALTLLRRAAQRAPADSGVVDAGICHGAAGLAAIFMRAHAAWQGDSHLLEAARFWTEDALARYSDQKLRGFDAGLLTGVAGVALVLLSAATSVAPNWDRALMLSPAASARLTR